MSKRKGMSADEKRDKMLEIFHESADVFVLKDVEKLSVKRGIVLQSVKDILQSLVDDDLVKQEKIGISNYFWSFPAETSVKICNEVKQKETELAASRKRRADLEAQVQAAKKGKEDSAERTQLLATLRDLEARVEAASAEIAQYRENDPETVQTLRQGTAQAKEAANRWLDNIECLRSWCRKQFQGNEEALENFFKENGYSDSMEYLE